MKTESPAKLSVSTLPRFHDMYPRVLFRVTEEGGGAGDADGKDNHSLRISHTYSQGGLDQVKLTNFFIEEEGAISTEVSFPNGTEKVTLETAFVVLRQIEENMAAVLGNKFAEPHSTAHIRAYRAVYDTLSTAGKEAFHKLTQFRELSTIGTESRGCCKEGEANEQEGETRSPNGDHHHGHWKELRTPESLEEELAAREAGTHGSVRQTAFDKLIASLEAAAGVELPLLLASGTDEGAAKGPAITRGLSSFPLCDGPGDTDETDSEAATRGAEPYEAPWHDVRRCSRAYRGRSRLG